MRNCNLAECDCIRLSDGYWYLGIAMGNAIDAVKEKADIVIGSNDEDGIAAFIEENILRAFVK